MKRKLAFYEPFFPVVYVDSLAAMGAETMKPYLTGKTSVLAGQTGAGKSSLLNAVDPTQHRATDAISKALGRGKHTTRTVELIPLRRRLDRRHARFLEPRVFRDRPRDDPGPLPRLHRTSPRRLPLQRLHPRARAGLRRQGRRREPGRSSPNATTTTSSIREEIKNLKIRY
ncbi:MAG: GTPase RsgA [Bacillus subtilis]|nr:GTPase RsgA [Bacillus subtilis]